jgi:hemerythrin-like domain-containing protein
MLIGIKAKDNDNFTRVADYIIKYLHGIRRHTIKNEMVYFEINKIDIDGIRVINYYITSGILVNLEVIT